MQTRLFFFRVKVVSNDCELVPGGASLIGPEPRFRSVWKFQASTENPSHPSVGGGIMDAQKIDASPPGRSAKVVRDVGQFQL